MPGASTWDPKHDKVMRRPDKQGRSGLQRFRKAAPVLTLKMIPIFLMLTILVQFNSVQFSRRLDCSLISVTQAEGLPWSLSKQNQLKTLISMSPGRWHPIRLSGMKRLFQSKPLFASILVCLTNVLMPLVLMHMTVHNTLIINSIKNLNTQKALIGTEHFGGEEALFSSVQFSSVQSCSRVPLFATP